MGKREKGFYWVKQKGRKHWIIEQYTWIGWSWYGRDDEYYAEIDETKIVRLGKDSNEKGGLHIACVRQQSELLTAFELYLHEEYGESIPSGSIDGFIKHQSS